MLGILCEITGDFSHAENHYLKALRPSLAADDAWKDASQARWLSRAAQRLSRWEEGAPPMKKGRPVRGGLFHASGFRLLGRRVMVLLHFRLQVGVGLLLVGRSAPR